MSNPRQTRVALAFCPDIFRADRPFLFAPVVAEVFNGSWARLGNAAASFPPAGTIFVPPELYPTSFRHRNLAAWEVEDQPDFNDAKFGARYRAIRPVDGPLEVVSIALPSNSSELRRHLVEEGMSRFVPRLDGSAILEFQDGRTALARLVEHPSNANRSAIAAGALAYPLPSWPPGKPPATQVLNIDNQARRIVTSHDLPPAPEALDLATLEEALTAMRRGGLGALQATPAAKIRRAIEQLEEAVKNFDGSAWAARRERLSSFLERARESADARDEWTAIIAEHPIFRSTVDSAIDSEREQLRASVKLELVAEESELHDRIDKLKQESIELEEFVSLVREDLVREESRLNDLVKGIAIDEFVAKTETKSNGLHTPEFAGATAEEIPPPVDTLRVEELSPRLPPADLTRPEAVRLTDHKQAVEHLQKNLAALGMKKASARLLSREFLVAASLGQFVLFRGSLADPVAEVCSISCIGIEPERVTVPVGATGPLDWNDKLFSDSSGVLIEGVNRSCLTSYGDRLRKLLADRALGRSTAVLPLIMGTLICGPGTLPVGPEMLDYGPVFDTDLLSWDYEHNAEDVEPGRCESSAWILEDSTELGSQWDDAIDRYFPKACIVWERIARAALNRLGPSLSPLKRNQPHASFAFAWLIPRYATSEGEPVGRPLYLPDDLSREDLVSDDQRLVRLLKSVGLEGDGNDPRMS